MQDFIFWLACVSFWLFVVAHGVFGQDHEPQLRMVHLLFRHGDRSPIQGYPNDIYTEADWPQGYGQLSQIGMLQEYELGQFLHDRYIMTGFLSQSYSRPELYVRSTDLDRTLMSGSSMLAGLYPCGNNLQYPQPTDKSDDLRDPDNFGDLYDVDLEDTKTLPIVPIPIHTVPELDDVVLVTDQACPASLVNQANNDKMQQQIMETYKDIYSNVSSHSGIANSFDALGPVLDSLYCQKMSDYLLPDWMTDELFQVVLELKDLYYSVRPTCRPSLVSDIVNHMINKTSPADSMTQKMFVYSAHDSTVAGLLYSLQVFNNKQPSYTACVIVELFEHPAGQFSVQISYRNDSDTQPYILAIPGCTESCPLETFISLLQPVIDVAQVNKLVLPDTQESSGTATIVVIVLAVCLLLSLVLLSTLCYKLNTQFQNQHQYAPVPVEMSAT